MKLVTNLALAAFLFVIAGGASADGKNIYETKCSSCHASGVAGAPKFGDKATWAPRVKTGMDAMLATVVKGKGVMPPKGGCTECSDKDLTGAIQYMADNSK